MSDEVASYLRELIMSGRLKPGYFIRQDALAEELQMSATPVREGLLALRGEGFVRLEPRRGFVVADLTREDIRDLFDAQSLLAGELAARAAGKLDDDRLRELAGIQQDITEAASSGSIQDVESLNHSFHRLINLSAESPKISWMLSVAVRCVPRRFFAEIEGWPSASSRDHEAILSALRQRDSDAARTAMTTHLRHAGELLVAHLTQRTPELMR
jgi:DNA-binding GntR family transcriptional regulator